MTRILALCSAALFPATALWAQVPNACSPAFGCYPPCPANQHRGTKPSECLAGPCPENTIRQSDSSCKLPPGWCAADRHRETPKGPCLAGPCPAGWRRQENGSCKWRLGKCRAGQHRATPTGPCVRGTCPANTQRTATAFCAPKPLPQGVPRPPPAPR